MKKIKRICLLILGVLGTLLLIGCEKTYIDDHQTDYGVRVPDYYSMVDEKVDTNR